MAKLELRSGVPILPLLAFLFLLHPKIASARPPIGSGVPDSLPYATHLHMDTFLNFCSSHDCVPDVLGWHDLGNSDPRSQDSTGMVNTPNVPRNLYSQVKYVRALSDPLVTQYEINEALNWTNNMNLMPGIIVRECALAERAKFLGLVFAGRTYWPQDPCEDTLLYGQQGRLAGLLQPVPGDPCGPYLGPRYAWWAEKAYAEMSGEFLNVSPTASADAVAAISSGGDTLRILVGNYSAGASEALHLVLKGLSTPLVVNSAVNVSVNRIPGVADSLTLAFVGLSPKYVSSRRYLVNGDSAIVEISANHFKAGDALSIEVTPITPQNVIAPGNFDDNEAAIQATDVGNTVIIARQSDGEAWQEDNIQLKNGVRVIAIDPAGVAIKGTGDSVVVFPEQANAFTSFEGVEIQAGTMTKVLIAVKGAGSVRDCVLKDMGQTSTTIGIRALNHTGEIKSCNLQFRSQPLTGIAKTGIDIVSSSSHIDSCSIDVCRNSLSRAVRSINDLHAEIDNSLIKGGGIGVEGEYLLAQKCTLDSSLTDGYNVYGGGIINCICSGFIFSHVVDYCIATGGEYHGLGEGVGNVVGEDPLYCSPSEYTLRIDSYGNPLNNPSGQQIGAFPVACAYGTLFRDTRVSGTATVLQDLIVPSGKTLELMPGAALKFDGYDESLQGSSYRSVELTVNNGGSLSAAGSSGDPVHFDSASSNPGEGAWWGIIGKAASISLDHAEVKHATNGLTLSALGSETALLAVSNSSFGQNQSFDLYTQGSSDNFTINVTGNSFNVGNGRAVALNNHGGSGSLVDNQFLGGLGFSYGIDLEGSGLTQDYEISGNTFSSFTNGDGILVHLAPSLTVRPHIVSNEFFDSHHGIYVTSGSAEVGGNTTTLGNLFEHNAWGLHVQCLAPPSISCSSCIAPAVTVRHNRFVDGFLPGYPLLTQKTASVDAGKGSVSQPPEFGYNSFVNNDSYCIRNNSPSCGTIMARGNYFSWVGSSNCESSNQCATSAAGVDAEETLCSDPNYSLSADVQVVALVDKPGLKVLRVNRAPFGSIDVEVSGQKVWVHAEVFDLSGRLERDLGKEEILPGVHRFMWDGKNGSGRSVPAGIHFLRLSTDAGLNVSAKVLMLRGGE